MVRRVMHDASAGAGAPARTRVQAQGRSGDDAEAAGRRLPPLLRRAWYGLNQAFRRRLAPLGLTPDQYTVLRTLREGEATGLTQQELTARMASDPNTMAALVARMAQAGWVERRPHERDRRAHRIRLLPIGRARFREALRIAHQLQSEVLGPLSDVERETFLARLEEVGTACQGALERSPRQAVNGGGR